MLTFVSYSKIRCFKTIANDKKLNFGQSLSYTPVRTTLKSSLSFCFTKQIFQKPRIFNKMNMVNNL